MILDRKTYLAIGGKSLHKKGRGVPGNGDFATLCRFPRSKTIPLPIVREV